MKNWNLQVILDKEILREKGTVKAAKETIAGGALCIQLRDKASSDKDLLEEAKRLRWLTSDKECLLIINDRIDIAIASGADGVHLGQEDLPYESARRLLGKNKIIGISTHNIEQAKEAQLQGADYIGVGPIFKTLRKPNLEAIGLDIVSKISEEISIPALFIGGITLTNIEKIIERGGRHIAVASAILNSDDITKTTKAFVSRLSLDTSTKVLI